MAFALGDVVVALKARLGSVRNCCCSGLSPCLNGAVVKLSLSSAVGNSEHCLERALEEPVKL